MIKRLFLAGAFVGLMASQASPAGICGSGQLINIINPSTGRLDYVCVYSGTGGGGTGGTINAKLNNISLDMNVSTINITGAGISATSSPAGQVNIFLTQNLPGNSTSYIWNTNSLQAGSTFYVSSGTVGMQLNISSAVRFMNGAQYWIAQNDPIDSALRFRNELGKIAYFGSNGQLVLGPTDLFSGSLIQVGQTQASPTTIEVGNQSNSANAYAIFAADNELTQAYFMTGSLTSIAKGGPMMYSNGGTPAQIWTSALQRVYVDGNGNVSIGTNTVPVAKLHVLSPSTTEQLRIGYNSTNYWASTVTSTGQVLFDAVGTNPSFTLQDTTTVMGLLEGSTIQMRPWSTANYNALTFNRKIDTNMTGLHANVSNFSDPTLYYDVSNIGGTHDFRFGGTLGYSLTTTGANFIAPLSIVESFDPAQMHLGYDSGNYWTSSTSGVGATTFTFVGSKPSLYLDVSTISVRAIRWPNGTIQVSSPTAGGGGDNLGNHISTKTITAGFGIFGTTAVFETSGADPLAPPIAIYGEAQYTGPGDVDAAAYGGYFVALPSANGAGYGVWAEDQTSSSNGGAAVYASSLNNNGVYGQGLIGVYGNTVAPSGIGVYATANGANTTALRANQSDPAGLGIDVDGGINKFSYVGSGTQYFTFTTSPDGKIDFDAAGNLPSFAFHDTTTIEGLTSNTTFYDYKIQVSTLISHEGIFITPQTGDKSGIDPTMAVSAYYQGFALSSPAKVLTIGNCFDDNPDNCNGKYFFTTQDVGFYGSNRIPYGSIVPSAAISNTPFLSWGTDSQQNNEASVTNLIVGGTLGLHIETTTVSMVFPDTATILGVDATGGAKTITLPPITNFNVGIYWPIRETRFKRICKIDSSANTVSIVGSTYGNLFASVAPLIKQGECADFNSVYNGGLSGTSRWEAVGRGTGNDGILSESNPIYMSSTGDDANDGRTAATAVFTATRTAAIGGSNFTVVMASGNYFGANARFDLSTIKSLKIKKDSPLSNVNIFMGEAVTSFTRYDAVNYPKIWYATIVSSIAVDVPGTGGSDAKYVFQLGTTEGTVSSPPLIDENHPLLEGKAYRLENFRLRVSTGINAVNLANGKWWFDGSNHRLYISKTDGGNPNGTTYYVPNILSTMSFVYNGVAGVTDNVEIEGVRSLYGQYGFDLSNVRKYKLTRAVAEGNYFQGLIGKGNEYGEEIYYKGLANGDDCIAHDGNSGTAIAQYRTEEALCIGNGDEGISGHNRAHELILGGYMYANYSGGITPALGCQTDAYNVTTATNALGYDPTITGSFGVTRLNVYNSKSIGDVWGFFNWGGGQVLNAYDTYTCGNQSAISASIDAASPVNFHGHTDCGSSLSVAGGAGQPTVNFTTTTFYTPIKIVDTQSRSLSGGSIDIWGGTAAGGTPILTYGNTLTTFNMRYGTSAQIQILSSRSLDLYSASGGMTFGTNNVGRMFLEDAPGTLRLYGGGLAQYNAAADTLYNFFSSTGPSYIQGGTVSLGTASTNGQLYVVSNSTYQLVLANDTSSYLNVKVSTGGITTVDVAGASATITFVDPMYVRVVAATASVTTPGLNAPLVVSFIGAQGGDANVNGASATGGIGSSITIQTGGGGLVTQSNTRTGGAGGAFTITLGAGGAPASASTQTVVGGVGGAYSVTSGAGGAASLGGSGTATGGAGGANSMIAGTGGGCGNSGNCTSGAGGTITITGGAAGTPSASGTSTAGNPGQVNITGGSGGSISSGSPSGGTGGATTVLGGPGASYTSGTSPAGGVGTYAGGVGGSNGGSTTAGVGGAGIFRGGTGGTPGSGTGGAGGSATFQGGDGANGNSSANGGNGGNGIAKAGDGGPGGSGKTSGNGGDLFIKNGLGGSKTNGATTDGTGGAIFVQTSSNSVAAITRATISNIGQWVLDPGTSTTGSPNLWRLNGPAHTGLTASVEASDIFENLNRTVQFTAGALSMQRAIQITSVTYSATSAMTISTAATVAIKGAPAAGTNMTISNPLALLIESGATQLQGDLKIATTNASIRISTGTNAIMGTAVLSGGTVVVNTTKVTANSIIILTVQGGTLTNIGSEYVSARTAGTSFTISSSNVLDASTVGWLILEPN